HLARRETRAFDEVIELFVHRAEAVTAEELRVAVHLELKLTELGRVVRVAAQAVEHTEHTTCRAPGFVDQEQLLLGTDATNAGLEHARREHVLECADVVEQRVHELALLLAFEATVDVLVLPRRHRVHSPRICGNMARHVNQSCGYWGPHESTWFGTPCRPSAFAIHQDSQSASARPSPDARWMYRVRRTSRCRPPSVCRKWSGV